MLQESGVLEERGPRRVAVGKTLLIAGVCAVIPLIGNVIASFLTTWTGAGTWLVGPAVGVGVAMVTALIQAYGSAPEAEHPRQQAGTHPPPRAPYPGHLPPRPVTSAKPQGIRLPLALVTALVVIGAGGLAVTEGVRYVVGYFSGNEAGTNRLVQPVSASARGVALTVEKVTYTAHFTQVTVAARNQTRESLTLPLYGYCEFTGSDGTTLAADPYRSHWSDSLAPGVLQRGTIVFPGHLGASVRQASLSFTQIFGPGGGGSITVRHLKLKPG